MLSRLNPATSEPTEGGTRKASLPLRALAAPLAIFALALAVRLIGITWGLPNATRWYSYHPDESRQQIIGAVFNLLGGDWNPHFFNYPSLYIYATYIGYMILSAVGLTTQALNPDYPWNVTRDILFAGRLFAACCGAGTAVLAYLTARELKLGRWAILAGVLAALTPGLVQHSHFATVDVPATFFVALCLWLTVRAKNSRGLLWAAAVAGLATGAKYNGIIVLVAPLLALLLLPNLSFGKQVGLGLGMIAVSLLAFLVTTPYALLSTQEFLGTGRFYGNGQNGLLYELLRHPKEGSGEVFANTGNGWWYHFSFNMPFAFTWPLMLTGIGGGILAARDRKYWPLLAFAVIYFAAIGTSQVRFMRYTFLLAPVLCVTAVCLGGWLAQKNKILGQVVLGLVALVTVGGCLRVIMDLNKPDPRDKAAEFLQGKTVALANKPWFYTPPIQPIGFNQPVPNIPVTGFDLSQLKAHQPVYFVVSEYEWSDPLRLRPDGPEAKFFAALGKISSTYINPSKLDRSSDDKGEERTLYPAEPPQADHLEPHDYLYTHPSIRVYRLPALSPNLDD